MITTKTIAVANSRGCPMGNNTPPTSTAHTASAILAPTHMSCARFNLNASLNANGPSNKPAGTEETVETSTVVPSNKGSNKLAMSRALGAAFLSHQVEQLEKSVSYNARVPVGGWRDLHRDRDRDGDRERERARDRRQGTGELGSGPGGPAHRRGLTSHGPKQRPPSGPKPIPRKEHGERAGYKAHEDLRDTKDADLVVVDASVLVHGLYQVKKWCKEGREEIVIVPLEALNTLDLLKKGTSPLAQRARSASRILEAQVGTNPRIRVQRDDAFVPWDRIEFKADDDGDKPIVQPLHLSGSPEWVRRMICCARWEVDNASRTLERTTTKDPKVVLAVLSHFSALDQVGKMTDCASEITSPVPLPAPGPHSHKYEPRSAGLLVAHWAARAGIELLEVEPSAGSVPSNGHVRNVEDDERGKRQGGRGRHNSHTTGSPPTARGTGLVERPPAVMQMMEMVAQPSKVVRVLARGEKLEPDT